VNYGTNTPQRDYPKSWQWKSAYHDFEHVLVGYITAQQLYQQPFTLHYAFVKDVDQATIHPYYFSGTIDSVTPTSDDAGNQYQAVTFHGGPPPTVPALAMVSAASFLGGPLAAESIATAWGSDLAAGGVQAQVTPLPTSLGGVQVTVTDSGGVSRLAPLFYVSPSQINFQVPAGTLNGAATIAVASGPGASATGSAQIAAISPAIFQLNTGTALAAASVQRVKADGSVSFELVYQLDAAQNPIAQPIDLGSAGDLVYLWLFGTGIRNARSVTATAGGQAVPVLYAGSQNTFAGLDQVNIGPCRAPWPAMARPISCWSRTDRRPTPWRLRSSDRPLSFVDVRFSNAS